MHSCEVFRPVCDRPVTSSHAQAVQLAIERVQEEFLLLESERVLCRLTGEVFVLFQIPLFPSKFVDTWGNSNTFFSFNEPRFILGCSLLGCSLLAVGAC